MNKKFRIKGSIIRFWRTPYPSANWCPRLELWYDRHGSLIQAKNNHDDFLPDDYAYLGEFELTIKEFNRLRKFCEDKFNL